jgi:hypothetical protein
MAGSLTSMHPAVVVPVLTLQLRALKGLGLPANRSQSKPSCFVWRFEPWAIERSGGVMTSTRVVGPAEIKGGEHRPVSGGPNDQARPGDDGPIGFQGNDDEQIRPDPPDVKWRAWAPIEIEGFATHS